MFEIEYKGANSVIISTKKSKIITDPKLSVVGLKDLSTKGVIELVTEDRFAVNSPDANLVINSPGDYGISGFDIHGIVARRNLDSDSDGLACTIYRIELEDTRIGLIGNIYEKLSDEQLEELGVVDILIIPVGGAGYTLDAVGAAGLVRMISPKIVIPVHYNDKMINYEVPQDELNLFVVELNAPVETVPKFKSKQSFTTIAPLLIVNILRS